jgi:hypothetical protein
MSKIKHPSGRPIQERQSRNWAYGPGYGIGFRLPRLRELHKDDGYGATNAIGFTANFPEPDWLDEECKRKGQKS